MTRVLLVLCCLLALCHTAFAEETPIDLKGSSLRITPPSGEDWKRRVDADAPGQWAATYQKDDIVLQALVFPVKPSAPADARKLLFQAVQIALRSVGAQGAVGTPTLDHLTVMGHRGAKATLSLRRRKRLHSGQARVLHSGAFWGFAWGILPTGSSVPQRQVVKEFVESMVPKAPSFFTPRFFDRRRIDLKLIQPPGEDPILEKHVLAMMRLIEISAEGPMCLSRREQMRQVILDQATKGDARFRDGMRATPDTFKPIPGVTEAEQRAGQAKLAESIHHGFLQRYVSKDAVAKRYMRVRGDSTRILLGRPPGEVLRQRDMDNLLEMFGFLASLAADGSREVTSEQRIDFIDARMGAWPDTAPEVRAAWTSAGADWLRLRYAWDEATNPQRLVFRRAVLEMLLSPEDAKTLPGTGDARALKRWMDAHGPLDMADVLQKAAKQPLAERQTLLKSLPTWPTTVPLGW